MIGKVAPKNDHYFAWSSGHTSASTNLDHMFANLTTYKNGIRVDFESSYEVNTNYVSASFIYGPYTAAGFREVMGSHYGYNEDGPFREEYTYASTTLAP